MLSEANAAIAHLRWNLWTSELYNVIQSFRNKLLNVITKRHGLFFSGTITIGFTAASNSSLSKVLVAVTL